MVSDGDILVGIFSGWILNVVKDQLIYGLDGGYGWMVLVWMVVMGWVPDYVNKDSRQW